MWKQVRVKYCILKARQTIWSRQKRCITSRRLNSNPGNQVISPLPDVRVTDFAVVGTDFAEPFFFKDSDAEQYILLITCTVTRSVRLELVGIMTTDIFLLALRRFIARRGLCFKVILNNARMFKRSELVLQQMWKCYTMQIKTNYYIIKRPVQLLHNLEIQD
ncbi:integrase catalytic domain-containing protein [Trichonephila inaurata madagascariensis]|uniref:Integrase catalytic domain-containing protein n=1 Tax=Trichonephila inaurata madagascariensis TaxID=2747483 RepID=A0A8X6YEM9_9ARAC|nr:integrase catalytic domain-containing protein [Trichonephila inaurata madagascariensis]